MKRIISLILVVVLCLALSVSAFAADIDSPGNGSGSGNGGAVNGGNSPKTGSIALATLAITACTAGGISVVAGRKAK